MDKWKIIKKSGTYHRKVKKKVLQITSSTPLTRVSSSSKMSSMYTKSILPSSIIDNNIASPSVSRTATQPGKNIIDQSVEFSVS